MDTIKKNQTIIPNLISYVKNNPIQPCLIFISHDISSQLQKHIDQVYVMENGNLTAEKKN